jgi:hypothetical protein
MLLILIALLMSNAYLLYWALKTPAEVFRSGKKRRVVKLIASLFFAFAVIGAFSNEHAYSMLFFAYPLAYAVLWRDRVRAVLAPAARRSWTLFGALIALLWPKELFVIADGPDPLIGHMVFYFGFYVGLALTITVLYRRWHYTAGQVFVIGGLWGSLVEQNFAGPALLLSGQIGGFLWFTPFIFVVYGLYLTGPYLLFYEEFQEVNVTRRWQRGLLFAAIVVLPILFWLAWAAVLNAAGFDTSGVG